MHLRKNAKKGGRGGVQILLKKGCCVEKKKRGLCKIVLKNATHFYDFFTKVSNVLAALEQIVLRLLT